MVADRESNFFRSLETIEGFSQQRHRLAKQVDVYTLVTFIGSSIILAGGLPSDSKISIFGIEGPGKLISLQLLAVAVSGVFLRFWMAVINLTIIGSMMERALQVIVGNCHSDFVIARYDATTLWTNMIKRRDVGYESPIIHKLFAATIPIAGLVWLVIHSSLVMYALWICVGTANINARGGLILSALTYMSFGAGVLAIMIFLLGFLIPMPFFMGEGMKSFLAAEKAKAANAAAHPDTLGERTQTASSS